LNPKNIVRLMVILLFVGLVISANTSNSRVTTALRTAAWSTFLLPAELKMHFRPPSPPVVFPVKLTAYHSRNCQANPRRGLTATGESACNDRGVAADWRLLPPGTLLQIPGVGSRKVDDTGTEMKRVGKRGVVHLDVRVRSYREACAFGMRWALVRLR
jgi:3D (Asp-Asp-Asp) domain-containing protein